MISDTKWLLEEVTAAGSVVTGNVSQQLETVARALICCISLLYIPEKESTMDCFLNTGWSDQGFFYKSTAVFSVRISVLTSL